MLKTCSFLLSGIGAALILACTDPAAADSSDDECGTMFAWITAERIRFQPDSAELRRASLNVLYRLAEFSVDCPDRIIAVIGHTDASGDADYNQALSEQRAQAVADTLAGLGVPRERLDYRGAGATEPVDDNDTAWGRERNRRIEFRLLPGE